MKPKMAVWDYQRVLNRICQYKDKEGISSVNKLQATVFDLGI